LLTTARTKFAVLTLLALGLLALPAAALASEASIKHVIEVASPKIDVAEGHVLTAEGEYETTHEAAAVQTAISESVAVLGSLRRKVAAQSAGRPRVRRARGKIVAGLAGVIASYGHVSTAFGEKASDPAAASSEGKLALALAVKGKAELDAGINLLS
jgi:hypothetical protein